MANTVYDTIRAVSTNANAAVRWIGGTASGSPSAGTWQTGDWIIDQTGKIWICTAGGTPGTWVAPGGVSSVAGRSGAVTLTAADIGTGTFPSGLFTFAGTVANSGQTNVTAASRWIGATTSGAPSAGTWNAGDFIIAQNGFIWICTAGGTPGTWNQMANLQAANTFTGGVQTATGWAASGLTGATTATRWVGGTVSGPPTSGTFSAGDHVPAKDGHMWHCVVGGSPGSWVSEAADTNPFARMAWR